jgi:GNAT superfamily N-acetyltransferase
MRAIITEERPDGVDGMALIGELQTHLESFYPPEARHGFSVERMVAEGVVFFVLRVDGEAAGCGGIKLFGHEYGELKRMYVRPRFRGSGLGKMILDRLVEYARERGARLVRLETGIHQVDAIRLYERAGFERVGPFGDYVGGPMNLFFEKRVGALLS